MSGDAISPAAVQRDVLLAAYVELHRDVIPALGTPDAVRSASMIGDLIKNLAARHDDPASFDAPGKAGSVAAAVAALTAKIGAASTGVKAAKERRSANEIYVTPEIATRLVRAVLDPAATIAQVGHAPGGFSKDTLFFRGYRPSGESVDVVIRRDLPYGPGETRVVDEHALLTRLLPFGLPIATPLALDPSAILGTPAMISARVPGDAGTEPWGQDPAIAASVCRQLAAVLAKLHAIPIAATFPELADTAPADVVRAYVLDWQARWRRNRTEESAILAQGFEWLLANIPATLDRVSVVHGDVGFHNTMVEDGRITALLDWEFSHAGDPIEDLSYCKQFVEQLMPWDAFMARYVAEGGVPYDEARADFFEVWRFVRNATTTATAWNGFVRGYYPAVKAAFQGLELHPLLAMSAGQMLLQKMKPSPG